MKSKFVGKRIKMIRKKSNYIIILETAVQDNKVMQDFELESLPMGVDHSQKVKAPPHRKRL